MATSSSTDLQRTWTLRSDVYYGQNVGNLYLMVSQGNPYSGADTSPDELPITETATITNIPNPLFFKKINQSGSDSFMNYVMPDSEGSIVMYSRRYREVPEAEIFENSVRQLYIEIEIPVNDILVSGEVRGLNIVGDLYTDAGMLATGDSYLYPQVDITNTLGNRLLYLQNIVKYERVQTEAGELIKILISY